MSARQETYRVYCTHEGWLVRTDCGHLHLGPYADQEHAITRALVAVRETKPSHLRITNSMGEWRAEVVYGEKSRSPALPEADSSRISSALQGAAHVSS
jgi:hypothetical protein